MLSAMEMPRGSVAILNTEVREGITEKVIFEQTLEDVGDTSAGI